VKEVIAEHHGPVEGMSVKKRLHFESVEVSVSHVNYYIYFLCGWDNL
jgi:hypothetical protein